MAEKPTYEELEQRVKDLEKEVLSHKQVEKEIAKFKAISDRARYGFAITDIKGNITYMNEYFAKIHGYEANELFGRNITVFHNEEQLNKVSAVNKALIKNGTYNNEEIWHIRKDGSVFPMLMSAILIKGENGKPLFFGATAIDITEQKEAEKGLLESEGRYRQLFENSMVGIGLADKSGRVLAFNDKMLEITGYSRDELPKLDITKTYANPKDREELLGLIDLHGKVDYFETRLLNKQGEQYWVSLSFCLIDYKGKKAILTSVIDISKRKQVEEELKETSHDLNERNKKLTGLFALSNLIEKKGNSLDEIIQGVAELIPPSWQYPEITCSRIILEDKEYKTGNFKETGWRQSNDIFVHGERSGILEVYYLEEKPEIDEGPFLNEERSLINAISERLGRIIERKQAEEALQKSEERLSTILEKSPIPTAVGGLDGSIISFNKALEQLIGYNQEEFIDVNDWSCKLYPDEEYREFVQANINQALEGKEQEQDEFTITCKDGSTKIVSFKTSFYQDGLIIQMVDITDRKEAEEELRESEGRYRQLFENSMVGIGLSDKSGRALDSNDKMVEITGYSKDELSRLNIKNIYADPKDRKKLLSLLNRYGEIDNFETRLLNKQGEEYWVNLSLRLIDHKGKKTVLTSLIDITERKLANENLKKSEKKHRDFLNNLSDIAYETDDMGNLTYANKAAEKMFGKPLKDLIGNPFLRLFKKNSQKKSMNLYTRNLSGENVGIFELEFTNGTVCQFKNSLLQNKGGMITGVSGIARDITKLKMMENELKSSQMQIKAMADSSFEAIFISEKGICLDQNPAAEKMFGYTKAENIGKNPISNFVPEDRERINNFVMSGYEKPYIVTAIRKDGTTFPCEIQARQTTYQGHSIRIASCRDITDRIKVQKITQKEKKALEKEILQRTVDLEETNTALGVLLKKRERDKADVEEKVVLNVRVMIEPYLKKLKKSMLNDKQMIYLNILESNVKEIISPFGQTLSSKLIKLTPTELKIANLIRQGKTTKEIAVLSSVVPETISCHRKNIRKKLNLTEKKLNLRTSLSRLA